MKRFRKMLAMSMSLLLLLPSLILPWQISAEEDLPYLVTEFLYKAQGGSEEAGVQTSTNDGEHVRCPVIYNAQAADLTKFDENALYLQMEISLDVKDSTINMLYLQPHSTSSLRNCRASAKEINAAASAKGWYTLSIPLTSIANDDGIDLTDIISMCFYMNTNGNITVQAKNLRIVNMAAQDPRAELEALLTGEQPSEDDYMSLTDYLTARDAAQTLLNDTQTTQADIVTALNVLKAAKDALVPIPVGVDKSALQSAIEEPLPDMSTGEYSDASVQAYADAKAAGQIVLDNKLATQEEVDAAVQAIADARAAIVDITYLLAEFPPVAGSDEDGVYTWTISNSAQFPTSTLPKVVDLSTHAASKLRFRVDIRLVSGDASKLGNVTLQPKNAQNQMDNAWDGSLKTLLADQQWHAIERDFSASINRYPDTWYLITQATLYLMNTPDNEVTLEIKNMRIVDITLEENKEQLQELINTSVGDASLYPEAVWQNYQDALKAAQTTIDEATTNTAVSQAQEQLQAALDALGKRGILMEAINESLPAGKTYTAASIAVYDAAKEAARELLADNSATNDDIDAAWQAVQDAKAALVETTFLAAQFPMRDQAETTYQSQGTYSVTNGIYRYEGTTSNIDSPAGLATEVVDLSHHDRTKLYMQFDILFEADSADNFRTLFIRPTKANGGAILNHAATEAVNAVSSERDVWHTISVPLATSVNLEEIAGMSFYMLGADTAAIFKVQVKDFRIVDLCSEPVLNTLFADGMMFQQNKPISVFGEGGADTTVSVTLYKDGVEAPVAEQDVTVGSDGRWKTDLLKENGLKGSYDTYTLKVKGDAISYTFRHILIGEVWVAGGQSNMEYNIRNDVNNTAILEKTDPYIRIFYEPSLVYGNNVDQPLTPDFNVKNAVWADATNTDRLKNASSLAYNFSLALREELDVPVGFLNVSLGGTYIEAWISREGIESDTDVKTYLQQHNRYYDEENWPQTFNRMSALYNQKIGALSGYQVAGALWYQGETNLQAQDTTIYKDLLELLQQDWGRVFGFGEQEMPFIFAHIAPHNYPLNGATTATSMAYFWEAMSDAWSAHPTSMAQVPIYDLPLTHYFTNLDGNPQSNGPIHPADKIPVAQRFAAAALNLVYDGTEAASAPVYKNMIVADGKIRITFDQTGSGLKIKDGASTLHGFAIAGEDGVYVDAYAQIVSPDTVEVWNDRVKDPQHVTYAFNSFNMAGNLQNATGIAAAPFRTSRDTEDNKLYLPKDWQYADGDVWVVTGSTDSTKWEDLWQSEKATLSYDTDTKMEGLASLKAVYPAGSVGIGPVYGKNSVINQFHPFSYVTIHIKNPDNREKTVKLQFTYGNAVYTAAPTEQEDAAFETRVTVAANSDFTAYTFNLTTLVDSRGTLVTNSTTLSGILKNASKMEWVLTDSADGTIYVDDIQFGLDALDVMPSVDKSDLQAAVTAAKEITVAYFTADTAKPFSDSLTAAETVLKDSEATQGEVDEATNALTNAQSALKPAYFAGDVNGDGDVTAADALMALQASTGKITLNDIQTEAANVDGQNDITANDALLILQFSTQKISSF